MSKITESDIENYVLELLESLGYEYIYAPDIAPDSDNPLRSSFADVVLESRLREALIRLNRGLPQNAI